jgi:hypothetical protein
MKYFVTPGIVALTPAALALAKAFRDQVPGIDSGTWIVTLSWANVRRMSDRKRGVTRDLGPGLDLGAHRSHQVPRAAVHVEDDLEYALQIPRDVVASAERKIIDVDPTSSPAAIRLL